MDDNKLLYWQQRLKDNFQRVTREMKPALDNIQQFTKHIDDKSEKQIKEKIQTLTKAISELADAVDATIAKKGAENGK